MKKNKKQTKPRKKAEDFFVAINNPSSVRLSFLESRKTSLESMKTFVALKEIRKQKTEQKNNLRKQLKQVSFLISRIRTLMPVVSVPDDVSAAPEIKEEVKQEVKKEKKPSQVQSHTELERIEAELREIEAKLSGLH